MSNVTKTDPLAEVRQWCNRARKLLGIVRGSAPTSGVSRKDLRAVRHAFDESESLLKQIEGLPVLAPQFKKFTEQYKALVKRLESSAGGDTTTNLGTEVKELNDEMREVAEYGRFKNDHQHWVEQLKRVRTLDARDALANLAWMSRDIGKALAKFARVASVAEQLKQLQQQVEDERQQAVERLLAGRDEAVRRWTSECEKAAALEGGKLLHEMERIKAEMEAMTLNFLACRHPAPDFSAVPLSRLTEKYEAGFPQRTPDKPAVVFEPKEEAAPKLKIDERDALKIFEEQCDRNWFTLKKKFKEGTVSKEVMQNAWAYRQKIVDEYMQKLESDYGLTKGAGWNAVGSVTLESDIDVSILDHYWALVNGQRSIVKTDAEIVKEFNDWFLRTFKAQPGIMFDVNLYASAPPRKTLADGDDASEVQKAMKNMTNAGQDVGALMKIRRYMSWEEYEAYAEEVIDQMRGDGASDEAIDTTRKQFEEADSLYQLSLAESLNKAKALIESVAEGERTKEQQKALALIAKELKRAETASGAEAQKILAAAAKQLEHMQDVNMWVNNELYTKGIQEVRELELLAESLQKEIEDGSLGPDSPQARKLAGTLARLKTLATDSIFFANEAYHSDGPFKHIVVATQGVKSDLERENAKAGKGEPTKEEIATEMKRRRDGLSIHLCLQSFNEQLGDLLKDLAHYADEPNPGVGFYRASKYLQRLLDALSLLESKAEAAGESLKLGLNPAELSKQVDGSLLAARKGKVKFDGIEDASQLEAEIQAYCIEQIESLFGVRDLAGLGNLFKRLGAQVNGKLRKLVAAEMKAAQEQESAYFA